MRSKMFQVAIALLVSAFVLSLNAPVSMAHSQKKPAWYLTGHSTMKIQRGTFANMPRDLRRPVSRQLAVRSVSCTPVWIGATYTFWDFLKHLHIKVVLWTVTEKVAYCTDGTNVTYLYRVRTWSIPALPVIKHLTRYNPWRFEGWVDSGYDCPGAEGSDAAEHCFDPNDIVQSRIAVAKAYFDVCIIDPICGNPQYPYVGIRVDGNGYTAKAKGNG